MPTLIEHLSRSKTALLAELALDVSSQRVLDAIARVPRERFVPEEVRIHAYENRPLPIGYGQTISQPLIVALMTQALRLVADAKLKFISRGDDSGTHTKEQKLWKATELPLETKTTQIVKKRKKTSLSFSNR